MRSTPGTLRWLIFSLIGGLAGVGALQAGTPQSPGPRSDTVTFTEHVAPIVFANCTPCHRPGEAAPFALMTYQDARLRGRLLAAVTRSGLMPPWKASPGDYELKNERRLTAEQIEVFDQWLAAGMPEGDPRRLPPPPAFTEGWQLGPPDLVVTMPEAFPVPADGPDVYRNFVLPLNLDEDRWVRAIDFRPSARAVVHHSLFFLDTTGAAREQTGRDGLPGYSGGMGVRLGGFGARGGGGVLGLFGRGRGRATGAQADEGVATSGRAAGLGGWALGGRARELPDGLAFRVPKGADLILSTHFHPSGKPEREASTVGLYFADAPPRQAFTAIQLPPLFGALEGLDIPAGESRYTIADSFVLPVDVKAFNVGAHAHYLGKEMKLTATLPGGESKILLWIEDWDFSWQEQYQYKDFVFLPKGTRLDVRISYDNSAANPRNPSAPPVRVAWGEQSTDEMGSVALQVVTADAADLPRLQQAYREHLREAVLTGDGLRLLLDRWRSRSQAVDR
jgi:hypothetical protein